MPSTKCQSILHQLSLLNIIIADTHVARVWSLMLPACSLQAKDDEDRRSPPFFTFTHYSPIIHFCSTLTYHSGVVALSN
jgi:hypothetical protein